MGRSSSVRTRVIAIGAALCSGAAVPALAHHSLALYDRGVSLTIEGVVHPSITNIGLRPTFGDLDRVIVETHLFDVDRDLYDRPLRLSFVQRMRDERAFPDVDALRASWATHRPALCAAAVRHPQAAWSSIPRCARTRSAAR